MQCGQTDLDGVAPGQDESTFFSGTHREQTKSSSLNQVLRSLSLSLSPVSLFSPSHPPYPFWASQMYTSWSVSLSSKEGKTNTN